MIHTLSVPRSNHPSHPSLVMIGNALPRLDALLDGRRVVVITDTEVAEAYGELIGRWPHVVIPSGEAHKTLATVESVCRQLIALGADRGSYLMGVGGGIVTDVTGFVASVYLRGVAGFGFVATSLLAQVDASVGGKNGVNLDGFKNMVGLFNQPDFVVCDQGMLSTLPQREVRAGMAEMIKCGLLGNAELFGWFEQKSYTELMTDGHLLHHAIVASVELKAGVVAEDEHETGRRKLLNLGHTFAHAVEKLTAGRYLHGEAVAIGLCVAAEVSARLGLLSTADCTRVSAALAWMGLPTKLPEGFTSTQWVEAVATDKKRKANTLDFIVLEGIGRAARRPLRLQELELLML